MLFSWNNVRSPEEFGPTFPAREMRGFGLPWREYDLIFVTRTKLPGQIRVDFSEVVACSSRLGRSDSGRPRRLDSRRFANRSSGQRYPAPESFPAILEAFACAARRGSGGAKRREPHPTRCELGISSSAVCTSLVAPQRVLPSTGHANRRPLALAPFLNGGLS